ncbi:hypothetical protein [Polaromonas aquatica]|uniref:hypothetical protein n=1 Tax=Polaromonas aquatica TaxID=332657 RepID=UPI003D6560CA
MGQSNTQKEQGLQSMLENFARAFTRGDGKTAATCWEVPALIVADQGTKVVATLAEVEDFYGGAAKQYNDMGITDTRPEVQSVTWMTDRLASVHVRWPYLDAKGQARPDSEASTYVVRFGDDGQPRINVVVMMGAQKGG